MAVTPVDWSKVSTELTDEQVASCVEPVGAYIIQHTQFELVIGRLIQAFLGLGDRPQADQLIHAIDAVGKLRILYGTAGVYKADPHGTVPDYTPLPDREKEIKDIARAFEASSKTRNILAHGTIGRLGDRVFMGSVSASSTFRNDSGSENWVYIDTVPGQIATMFEAMQAARQLREKYRLAAATLGTQ